MRHGVIADVHGNEVALRAVLDDAASCGVDRWWVLGVLCQAGLLDTLMTLPTELRLQLPDGTRVLGVHASPGADDGPGIEPGPRDEQLGALLAGCAADIVIGGHTHRAADRTIAGIRALNPGSTGIPERPGEALAPPRPRPPRPGVPRRSRARKRQRRSRAPDGAV